MIRVNSEGSIAEAAELYGGLLLADVIVNEDAWNDWLVGERERLSESAIGAMVQQGRRELAAGRAEAALRLGWRATSFNKFREMPTVWSVVPWLRPDVRPRPKSAIRTLLHI